MIGITAISKDKNSNCIRKFMFNKWLIVSWNQDIYKCIFVFVPFISDVLKSGSENAKPIQFMQLVNVSMFTHCLFWRKNILQNGLSIMSIHEFVHLWYFWFWHWLNRTFVAIKHRKRKEDNGYKSTNRHRQDNHISHFNKCYLFTKDIGNYRISFGSHIW